MEAGFMIFVESNGYDGKFYVDTFPKNDVISFPRNDFCALRLGLKLWLELELGLRLGLE